MVKGAKMMNQLLEQHVDQMLDAVIAKEGMMARRAINSRRGKIKELAAQIMNDTYEKAAKYEGLCR